MRSGPLSFLLRLLLACSLVLGGWAPASAQVPAGGGQPQADNAMPCHEAMHAEAGVALHGTEHSAGHGPLAATPTHDCCGSAAACLGHCSVAGVLPVAVLALPALALPVATLPWPADALHAQPAPDRLIRPPIVS